jgi:hypothetical protein
MRNKKAATPILLMLLTGCCLVTQGTSQEVTFDSVPPGASFAGYKLDPPPGGPTLPVPDFVGVTPKTLTIPKEDYKVVFTLQGFKDKEAQLKCRTSPYFYGSLAMGLLSGGVDWLTGAWKEFETDKLNPTLDLKPGATAKYTFKIWSIPSGARIEVEGSHHGVTVQNGTAVVLWWESHQQEKSGVLRLPGHKNYPFKIRRDTKEVITTLEELPVPVQVRFTSNPPGAKVEIDGQYQGFTTPWDVSHEWKPSIKERTVKLTMDGYRDQVRKFTMETKTVAVDMEEILRQVPVQVETIPAGAAVEVDGVSAGETPGQVTLVWSVSRRSNNLIISRPGYQSEEVKLSEAQAKAPVKVRLRPMLPKLP